MEYNWEKYAKKGILPHIIDLNEEIFEKYEIIGIAIANTHTAEACFVPILQPDGSIYAADCFKDVKGDVDRIYDNSLSMAFRRKK